MLASASDYQTIRLWDTTTGQCLQTLESHRGWVKSVAFRPDGKILASASDDQTICFWDTIIGQCLQTLEDYSGWVESVAFRSDNCLYKNTNQGFVRLDANLLE
jgi:WD40 repeat protein